MSIGECYDRQPTVYSSASCTTDTAQSRKSLVARSVAGSIVFAILAFVWPGLTLLTLVLLYGAYALVDGVCAHIAAFAGRKMLPT